MTVKGEKSVAWDASRCPEGRVQWLIRSLSEHIKLDTRGPSVYLTCRKLSLTPAARVSHLESFRTYPSLAHSETPVEMVRGKAWALGI